MLQYVQIINMWKLIGLTKKHAPKEQRVPFVQQTNVNNNKVIIFGKDYWSASIEMVA